MVARDLRALAVASLLVVGFAGCASSATSGGEADSGVAGVPDALVSAPDAQGCTEGELSCSGRDVLQCVDGEITTTSTCSQDSLCASGVCEACESTQFEIDTQQSCSIALEVGGTLDAEAFITVAGEDHRVLAMDRWGAGHLIAWCDSTTVGDLVAAFNALEYLGQTPTPRVASFGDRFLCEPGAIPSITSLPATVQYLGDDLPAIYRSNSAQLAADYDALIFCGFRVPWDYDWAVELRDYVEIRGKGLLMVMDYEGIVLESDFMSASLITQSSGVTFNALNLEWAPASTSISLDCVPDLPIID